MSTEMAIVARGLTKRYKQVTAVNTLDLDIPRGTIYGFLGPNGAGKTTTIRMLLGLVAPTSGSASIFGHDILHDRHAIARKVGAIVESPAFYTYLSGEDNLALLARSSNIELSRERIGELIERVGLSGRGRHKVKTYSLGMKQRLGIAATLLNNPEIIFLDEPTNGLDPAGTVEVRNLIKDLGREGRTIFLSSHLLAEVEQVCSYVAIVQNGVTRLQGRVSELLQASKGLAFEVGSLEQALAVFRELPDLAPQAEDERWVRVMALPDAVPDLVRRLVAAGVDIYQIQVRRNTLEQLFLELTGQPDHSMLPQSMEAHV